jgi:hypothetical protein
MTMVERVAHALSEEADWDGVMPHRKDRYLRQARAAIAAMREPTEEMVDAGYLADESATGTWQAMIDTAIHGPVPATADPIGFDLPQGEME